MADSRCPECGGRPQHQARCTQLDRNTCLACQGFAVDLAAAANGELDQTEVLERWREHDLRVGHITP